MIYKFPYHMFVTESGPSGILGFVAITAKMEGSNHFYFVLDLGHLRLHNDGKFVGNKQSYNF